MPHIVLMGDSVFDNTRYVQPEPDVAAQLHAVVRSDCRVTLRAVDGAVTSDVLDQLRELPRDTTHLVLSVGGNDLLGCAGELLRRPVRESSEAFLILAGVMDVFETKYRRTIDACLSKCLSLTVCAIYNGNFAEPEFQTMTRVVVAAFNDVIFRVACEKNLPAIDLRLVCTNPADFANPIEPSSIGGQKIAQAILSALGDGLN